jgi:Type I phosphodiesterase / nucleotide pyrophosphatase
VSRASRLTLCVFIDALGYATMRGRPFASEVLGPCAPLESVFGYSCACCPTILTGRMPRDHGHLAFYAYSPEPEAFKGLDWLGWLPAGLADRGRVRRWLSRGVARLRGYDGYFQLYDVPFERLRYFDYTEKRDIYKAGGIVTGLPTLFDRLTAQGVDYHVSDWRASEQVNLRAAERAIERGAIALAYVYLPALDALLHARGAWGEHLEQAVQGYEKAVQRLTTLARRHYDEVRVHVFSDHGMTPVHEHCNLMAAVEALGLEFGRHYVAMYDSTMARFWYLDEAAREPIAGVLAAESRGRVLDVHALTTWECDFADHRYGETIFLLDPGVLLCPSYMGRQGLAGMHGYDPQHELAQACYFSSHPPAQRPRRLDDLCAVMLADALGGDHT